MRWSVLGWTARKRTSSFRGVHSGRIAIGTEGQGGREEGGRKTEQREGQETVVGEAEPGQERETRDEGQTDGEILGTNVGVRNTVRIILTLVSQ